jgi:hypothetical protein
MLQSKFHRPWQPRVSGSQPYNPSAHTAESEVTFSEAIGEIEESAVEIQPPPAIQEAAPPSGTSDESPSTVVPASPWTRWYANLVGRFAKH